MKKEELYVIYFTKERGRLELSREEWIEFDDESITRHRTDGPAVEWHNNSKEWWKDGKRHRIDGPAIERSFGVKAWWIDGEPYSEEEFNKTIQEVKVLPLELRLTDPRWWVREMTF